MIIKAQFPIGWESGDLFVYTKKNDFVYSMRKQDSPSAYDRIIKAVKAQGMGGIMYIVR